MFAHVFEYELACWLRLEQRRRSQPLTLVQGTTFSRWLVPQPHG